MENIDEDQMSKVKTNIKIWSVETGSRYFKDSRKTSAGRICSKYSNKMVDVIVIRKAVGRIKILKMESTFFSHFSKAFFSKSFSFGIESPNPITQSLYYYLPLLSN